MIANAHVSIRQSLDCKILSQLAIGKVVSAELVLPIAIRFDLVDKDRPVFPAMPRQVTLTVTIDVEPSRHPSALNRHLPDRGMHGFCLATRCRVAGPHLPKACGACRSPIEAILSREQFYAPQE
jgi:hypothetical protein